MGRIATVSADKKDGFYKVVQTHTYKVLGHLLEVPIGFITDLASVPRYLWLTFPPSGLHNGAAILHDYLYSKFCRYKDITREEADKIFLELMKELGVPAWKRYAMYYAVRLFGKSHFRKGD